jgi:8-oxo-dGTP diphosphatase
MNAPHDDILPVSADVVVFTMREDCLSVLLVPDGKRAGHRWRLPGGPIQDREHLDRAAERNLQRDAGLSGVFLEQLYTFGAPDRDSEQRVITVAYYALVSALNPTATKQMSIGAARLFPVNSLPVMMLDHDAIVGCAHRRLAAKLEYSTIALQFMPSRFPLSGLQRVYEAILGTTLDKRNFRKRILALDCLEETRDFARNGRHRPARLYRIKTPGRVEIFK